MKAAVSSEILITSVTFHNTTISMVTTVKQLICTVGEQTSVIMS
jgi:hypothetical protein